MMRTAAIAYPRSWRIAGAVLVALSRGSLLAIAALLLFPGDESGSGPLSNPLRLMRAFAIFSLVPGVTAWIIERAFATELTIQDGTLVLQRRGQRIEVPCRAIDGLVPWIPPLPSPGVWLRLSSGRWFDYGLQERDPVALAGALADAGASEQVRRVGSEPAAVYAGTRRERRWYHGLLSFVVFALVPTLPVFRLHQWIAYGGTFGEYYAYGLRPYVIAFAIYWGTAVIYLVLWAALLRALLEPLVVAGAWLAPERAPAVRRAVETVDRVLYYGSVPLFLGRLFLRS